MPKTLWTEAECSDLQKGSGYLNSQVHQHAESNSKVTQPVRLNNHVASDAADWHGRGADQFLSSLNEVLFTVSLLKNTSFFGDVNFGAALFCTCPSQIG